MAKITIYQKPTCTTCRRVFKMLKESGVDFDDINYYINPLSRSKLKDLIKKSGLPARDFLRRKEAVYKDLKLSRAELDDQKAVDLMVKYPDLLQRPIVEKGAKAVLARPAERVREIL